MSSGQRDLCAFIGARESLSTADVRRGCRDVAAIGASIGSKVSANQKDLLRSQIRR